MAIGQNETQSLVVDLEEEVTPPKFTGIENGAAILETDNSFTVKNYLLKNVICPKRSAECWLEGTEIVQFTITASGNVNNFKVINSVSPDIDKEIIRVLKTTNGMWKPGYLNGEPTAMEKEVSILFRVGDYNYSEVEKHFTNKATYYFKEGSLNLLVKNNPKKALKHFNNGVRYLPNDTGLLMLRGICNYELGDTESAKRDWDRIVILGGIDTRKFNDDLVGMIGYSKMTNILTE